MASKSIVAVVTADMVNSRRYGKKSRTELDRAVRQSFSPRQLPGSLRDFKVAAAGFHITVGDEFQFVSKNLDLVLPFVTHLRARLARLAIDPKPQFRVSVGVGTVVLARSGNAYEQDGPAFVLSRRGLNALKEASRGRDQLTTVVTGTSDRDREFDAVLALMDHMQRRWTRQQFEAADLALQGATLQEASAKIGVRYQNVHKRLRAAGWFEYKQAQDLLSGWLLTLAGVN
jgi:hypothetical protein